MCHDGCMGAGMSEKFKQMGEKVYVDAEQTRESNKVL